MRDVPGLNSEIFARAASLSERAGARMRGATPPSGTTTSPARAEMPPPKIRDGIATLRLYDVIDPDGGYWGISALEFAEALDEIDAQAITEIELHINSRGGSVWDGLTILNSLRQLEIPVTSIVNGIAASAASFISVACDDVVMMPNSQMMIHDAFGLCVGQAEDMRAYASFLDDSSDNIATIYASKAGDTAEAWREVMKSNGLNGRWYSPEQAKEAGLIDRVGGAADSDDAENSVPQPPVPTPAPAPAPPDPEAKDESKAAADAEFLKQIQAKRHEISTRTRGARIPA